MAKLNLQRIGEISFNKYGQKMTLIQYVNALNITVKFESGYITKTCYSNFKKGNIKDNFYPIKYNVGFIGYTTTKNEGKDKKSYKVWNSMLERCYSNKSLIHNPTYKDCTVCREWHCFANFEKWFDENYYEIDNETMCLDKDILVKGNKIYSPETCIFVPQRINTLFCKSDSIRGKYQIGVSFDNKQNSFMSYMTVDNNFKFLGYYNNEQDAFNTYKKAKEKYIKKIAEQYKEYIPQKLYEAMYKWKVEETD